MIEISKEDVKEIIKCGARNKGITEEEYRNQIEEIIESLVNSSDSKIRKEIKEVFGDNIPSPEEYIYEITKTLGIAERRKIRKKKG